MEMSVKTVQGEVKKIEKNLKVTDLIAYISIHFQMIPINEVQKSLAYFCSLNECTSVCSNSK